MAGDPNMVPLLLGLGVDELSVAPPLIARVKYIIRRLKLDEATTFANRALKMHTSDEILQACRNLLTQLVPEIMPEDSNPLSPS
jgi:phosphotransferase system enzyme I (PtsI)